MPQSTHRQSSFRRGTAHDAAALAAFAARTFEETFGHSTSAEHMAAHVAAAYGVEQQTCELEDPASITLILEHDDAIAAFAQVRRRPPPEFVREQAVVELQRFYVDSRFHGRGIAQQMMADCDRAARELGGGALWLSVWEHNARALAFYTKCGFTDAGTTDFWLGNDRQTDHILVRHIATAE